jgi:hypothetical protein
MKIENIKEEVTHDMETSEKRMKQKQKHSGRPLQLTRTNRRQNLST